MNLNEIWEKALKKTEVVRARIKPLEVFQSTKLPYIFLAESALNQGDTVVRKGIVTVEKPSIILPDNSPHFEGFELEEDFKMGEQFLNTFFLMRGVRFPSMNYNNQTQSLDIHEGSLQSAVEYYSDELQRAEDLKTGLVLGPEDCWQFSMIILIAHQVLRQSDGDIKRLLEEYRKNNT